MKSTKSIQDFELSYEKAKKHIEEVLEVKDEIKDDDNLIELGLSSLDIMIITNMWRKMGSKVTFAQLIQAPYLGQWLQLLDKSHSTESPIKTKAIKVNMHSPFGLTDVQYAYWIGRCQGQYLGNVGCHGYMEFDGQGVDPEKLSRAWLTIQEHHPMLRAQFSEQGQQVLEAPRHGALIVHDYREVESDEVEPHLNEIRNRLSHRVLNVEDGQVTGLELVLLPQGKTRIIFDIDLLVADVTSFQIILRDLAALYARNELPQAPTDWNFAEYLHKEKTTKAPEVEKAKNFWADKLKNMPGAPTLPLAKSPEHVVYPKFKRREIFIEPEQWQALKNMAAAWQITPAMVLLTLYGRILHKWSENNRFLMNLTLFNRESQAGEIDNVVADFTALLLMEMDFENPRSFLEQVRKVQDQFHQNMEHLAYSAIQIQRDYMKLHPGTKAVAPVVFSYNVGIPLINEEFQSALGDMTYMVSQTPQVWLDFQLYDLDKGLLLVWDAVDELFPPNLLDDMFNAYKETLTWLVEDKENWHVSPTIAIDHQLKIRNDHIETDNEILKESIHAPFFAKAKASPDNVAIIDPVAEKELSYGELSKNALSIAAYLQNQGLEQGECVAISLERGCHQIEAILGVLAAGGVYVPVGVQQPKSRKEVIYKKSSINRVIVENNGIQGEPSSVTPIPVDEALKAKPISEPIFATPEASAYVIFTSGSTGEPKGVEIAHGAAVNTIADINKKYHVCESDRVLTVSAIDFDLSVYDIFGLLGAGGALVLVAEQQRRDAAQWLGLMQKYNVTIWNSVPVLYDMLLLETQGAGVILNDCRLVCLSGDWIGLDLPTRLKDSMPQAKMIAMGGATEASIWSNYFEVESPLPEGWKSIPYGYPLANQKYRIVDAWNEDSPDWVPGELWIGGDGVAKGYLGDPEQTKDRFVFYHQEQWYRTGDFGRYWPDGVIEFLGRKDQQVKIRGHRIELEEIEAALKEHAGIQQAVVLPLGEGKNRFLVGFIVPASSQSKQFQQDHLENFLLEKLPGYMVPTSYVVLDELPVTANGKIDRKALTALGQKAKKEVKPGREPQTEMEIKVAGLWQKILKASQVSLTDSFYDLGGDSLLATQLIIEHKKVLNIDLSLETIFRYPVLAKFIEVLENQKDGEHTQPQFEDLPPVIINKQDQFKPFPLNDIQHSYWIGRSGLYSLGGVSTHFYLEMESDILDSEKLNKAWNKLIQAHPMMRAVILENGQSQVVKETVPEYKIRLYDKTSDQEQQVEKHIASVRQEMAHQSFNPSVWPLFDIRASKCSKNKMILHISFDNIVFDAFSIFHLFSEWSRVYNNIDAPLPELELTFRDYILAVEDINQSPLYQKDLAYWQERALALPPAPALPLAKQPDELTKQEFRRFETKLSREEWQSFQDLAGKYQVTPSVVLMAAYAEVLGAYSKSQKFTLNLTRFNRLPIHPEVNELIGDFSSLTLLEVDNHSASTFRQRCQNLQEQLWKDLDHPYVSGIVVEREIMKLSGNNREITMPVVFTSVLGFDNGDNDSTAYLGEIVYSISETPQVWLDHQVSEQNGELILSWDSLYELFAPGMIDEMFDVYKNMLDKIASDEKTWEKTAASLIDVPKKEVRDEANNTQYPSSDETLLSLFEKQLKYSETREAVITSQKSLTYSELNKRANALAALLLEEGVQPNTLVAVVMEKGWEQIVAVLAILKVNAAYMPVDASNPSERIELLLKKGKVSVALTQSKYQFVFSSPVKQIAVDLQGELDIVSNLPVPQPADLAYVIFTSGSTGEPKGVMIDHRGAVNTINDVNRRFNVTEADRAIGLSNLNFDLSVYDIFGLLAVGGALVLPDPDKVKVPNHWVSLIQQYKVTVWNTVPMFMQMLTEHCSGSSDTDLSNTLRLVLLSGDWIPTALPDKMRSEFKEVDIIGLGGATEASIWSNFYPIEEVDPNWKSIPYGKPLSNQKFYILNSLMEDCPIWVPGDLYIGGDGVALGYWDEKEKTAASFITHPRTGEKIYKTGDLGKYFPDGNIEFLGRGDFQVKVNGYRIELGEVETNIKQLVGIDDAVVTLGKDSENPYLVGHLLLNKERDDAFIQTLSVKEGSDSTTLSRWNAGFQEKTQQIETLLSPNEMLVFSEAVELLGTAALCHYLCGLDLCENDQAFYSLSETLEIGMVDERFHILIESWLERLCEKGILSKTNEGYGGFECLKEQTKNLRKEGLSKVSGTQRSKIDSLWFGLFSNQTMCVQLLRGQQEPIELLTRDMDFLTPDKLGEYIVGQQYMTNLMSSAIKTIVNQEPGREFNVLELGTRAGQGTEEYAKAVEGHGSYTYSDESHSFLERKEQEIGSSFIQYNQFDFEVSADIQSFPQHSFDLIVADNTLHRSKNLHSSLANLKKLLKPQGLILFSEGTENSTLLLATVAFFEDGYKNMTDERSEKHLPLLSPEEWQQWLTKHEFGEFTHWPQGSTDLNKLGQHFMVAEAPKEVKLFSREKFAETLGRKIPDYMIPQTYLVYDKFPLTANGKVDRKQLSLAEPEKRMVKQGKKIEPKTKVQKELSEIWSTILQSDAPSIRDNFFESGGDSLKAVQFVNSAKEQYDYSVSLEELFSGPTLFEIAETIEEKTLEEEGQEDEFEMGVI